LIEQIKINMLEDICEHVNPSVMVCVRNGVQHVQMVYWKCCYNPMQNNNWQKVADSFDRANLHQRHDWSTSVNLSEGAGVVRIVVQHVCR
jgi:hypothetical protein